MGLDGPEEMLLYKFCWLSGITDPAFKKEVQQRQDCDFDA